MAVLPHSLCLALTLLATSSCLMADRQPESANSSKRWGAEELNNIPHLAEKLRNSGDYPELESLYRRALQHARALDLPARQLSFLIALGNAQLLQFEYAEAFSTYAEARQLAERAQDWKSLLIIANNLSSAYVEIGDLAAALEVTRESLSAYQRWSKSGAANDATDRFLAPLELQNARLHMLVEPAGNWESALYAVIDEARRQVDASPSAKPGTPDRRLEALAWDLLGELRLRNASIADAEQAFYEGHRLRFLHAPEQLFYSYWRLAELRLAQARVAGLERGNLLQEAQQFNQKYWDVTRDSGSTLAEHLVLHQRGRIRRELGRMPEALRDFAKAAELAERWRAGVLPASANLIASDLNLERFYDDYIETAAAAALRTSSRELVRESLLANERTRAASLRRSMNLSEVWREKLPDRYWDTLARLRLEASRQATRQAEISRLELEISRMEAAAGIGEPLRSAEPLPDQSTLRRLQQDLKPSELLLSFHTGEDASYLWTISNDRLQLYELAGEPVLRDEIGHFLAAIASDEAERIRRAGSTLYRCLFGQLQEDEQTRTDWLISADGPLFDLPFAALVSGGRVEDGLRKPVYLVEQHSVQTVPGAFLMRRANRVEQSRSYLGVGDPVYNLADPRLQETPPRAETIQGETRRPLNPVLARLIATGREVRESAGIWKETAATRANVLAGSEASRQRFLDELKAGPGTIHLATHVFQSTSQADQSFIAFSVDPNGSPELLGTADIGMLEAPGALVVMTGCSSGGGEVRPGAGLLGLTRAWLLAGAAEVLATQWPVRDRSSSIIPEFYRQLDQTDSAAQALRRSQLVMLQAGGWEASPSHWASYQITGGAR